MHPAPTARRAGRRVLPGTSFAAGRRRVAYMTPRWREMIRTFPRSGPASSGKVPDTHSVGPICDHDFSVFTVTNIATENTDAVPPAHPVPRMPQTANQGLQRCRGPRVPLTCLAPLAAWQSLCTGHVDASQGKFCPNGLHRGGSPERREPILPPALRRSACLPSATARPTRKQAHAFHPRTGFRDVRAYYEKMRW